MILKDIPAALAVTIIALGPSPANADTFRLLHSFGGYAIDDGADPGSIAVIGSTLIGTTAKGGVNNLDGPYYVYGPGSIYTMTTTTGAYSIAHSFKAGPTDGAAPTGDLTQSGGILYGSTRGGGGSAYGNGTVYSISATGGAPTILHVFTGGATDGAGPFGGLVISGSTLFGTASIGDSTCPAP